MKMHSRFLSEEEKRIIHYDSLRILAEVGIHFPSEKVLGLLEDEGAKIDWEKQVAYISEGMVEEALRTTPHSFLLAGRNPAYDLALPSAFTAYNLDGCGVNTLDHRTGIRRQARLADVADAARIFEEMDLGYILWPPVSPSDVPHEARSIHSTGTSFLHTGKHVQDEVKTMREVPYLLSMLQAIQGDLETLRQRPIYSVTYCTVAPLSHDGEMLEANLELTKYGIPILIYPMPACGTTGPASLYSNLAVANAEALSAIVVFQLFSPGTPLIYGSALGVVNVRSGMFLEGAPETMLQMGAMGELARYYGLPNTTAGCLTDAKVPGMQSVMEKMLTTLPLVLSGVDVVQGIGLVESSMTLSLNHMVIDNEIAHLCKRVREGVAVSEEKNYFEDVKSVGPGGHFLKQKTTRAAFRSDEFYQAEFCDRGSYEEWFHLGRPDLLEKAGEKVENILKGESKAQLPQSTEKILAEIMDAASRV